MARPEPQPDLVHLTVFGSHVSVRMELGSFTWKGDIDDIVVGKMYSGGGANPYLLSKFLPGCGGRRQKANAQVNNEALSGTQLSLQLTNVCPKSDLCPEFCLILQPSSTCISTCQVKMPLPSSSAAGFSACQQQPSRERERERVCVCVSQIR